MEGHSLVFFLVLTVTSIHLARSNCADNCKVTCTSQEITCRMFSSEEYCDKAMKQCQSQCESRCRCQDLCGTNCDKASTSCLEQPSSWPAPMHAQQCGMQHQGCRYNCRFVVFCNEAKQDSGAASDTSAAVSGSESGSDAESESE